MTHQINLGEKKLQQQKNNSNNTILFPLYSSSQGIGGIMLNIVTANDLSKFI